MNKVNLIFFSALFFIGAQSVFCDDALPFYKNETIKYAVKLNGITIGKAVLNYKGITKLGGRDAHLIIFSTDTLNFKDTETMYADIDSFLPLKIERDINNWGRKIFIIEEYDQNNNSVKITRLDKNRKSNSKPKEIKQDAKIQNVILSTYLYRKNGDFSIGREFSVTLPLYKALMRITKEVSVRVPHGSFMAYLLESFPKGHQIWFESSKKAIPVRILGPSIAGKVNMVMTEYKER